MSDGRFVIMFGSDELQQHHHEGADKRGGKPCIRSLRITVHDILDYLASGTTTGEILADFPDLTAEDIRACLAFATDRERRVMGRSA